MYIYIYIYIYYMVLELDVTVLSFCTALLAFWTAWLEPGTNSGRDSVESTPLYRSGFGAIDPFPFT